MLFTQYIVVDDSITLSSSGANNRLAQGIKIKRDAVIGRIYLYLTLEGAPGGYLQASLYDDGGGPSSLITNGASDPVLCTSIVSGWNAFDFNTDIRPQISDSEQMYIVLTSSGGYAADATNYVAWNGDQTTPHYTDGAGYTYDAAWTALSTATDLAFKIYSGVRQYVYSKLRDVEHLSVPLTDRDDNKRFNFDTNPSIEAVLDYEGTVADRVDSWVAGAGLSAPLTATADINLVRGPANYCVALECEMMHRTAGFYTQEGDTRAAALRKMCNELRDDLAKSGAIYLALRASQDGTQTSGSGALSAGQISEEERDERGADNDIIQPAFEVGMWDS